MASSYDSKSEPSDSLEIEDADGNSLLSNPDDDEAPFVVATDAQGNSLTLLEEYARRKNQKPNWITLAFSALCAVASLAFAARIYLTTQ